MSGGAVISVGVAGRAVPRTERDRPSAAPRRRAGWRVGPTVSALAHAAILCALILAPKPQDAGASFGSIPVELIVESGGNAASSPPMPAAALPAPAPIPPAATTHETRRTASASPATVAMPRPTPKPRAPEPILATDTPIATPPPAPTPASMPAAASFDGARTETSHDAAAVPATSVASAQGATSTGSEPARRSDYLAAVVAWLERHKEYPEAARRDREEGTALIAFTIDRGGNVLSFDIRRSAGNDALDRAARDMVRRSNPLPAMPASYPGTRIELVLPVTFALE